MKRLDARAHYRGETAREYDAARTQAVKWRVEQELVADLLRRAGAGPDTNILDVPVGTGRFFPFYREVGANVVGVDVSADMLEEARRRIGDGRIDLRLGDVTALDLPDKAVDISVCIRLLNLVDARTMKRAVDELVRVTRGHLLLGIRTDERFARLSGRQMAHRAKRRVRELAGLLRPVPASPQSRSDVDAATHGLRLLARERVAQGSDGSSYDLYLLAVSAPVRRERES